MLKPKLLPYINVFSNLNMKKVVITEQNASCLIKTRFVVFPGKDGMTWSVLFKGHQIKQYLVDKC